ncbi:MAG: EI24 domain-containing protein [Bacteroidetes bacterium]|nr:EI24 domain-containing protein [Bacteroidota bacterium]
MLFEKDLWPYMFIPLILWVLLWVASIYGLFILAGGLSEWLSHYVNAESIPENGHWLSWARPFLVTKISFLIGIVLKVLFWFLSGTFIKYFLLMLLSPVFALLSESAEEKLSGRKFPFSFIQLIKDVIRGIGISLRNMLLEYFFMFACFLLTLIFPPLVIITTPFVLFLGWYYVGFTLLDYNSERHKFKIAESTQFIKQNKGYACGIGFVYSFFLALPFLAGSIIGMMFGPALAVVGGTISFLQIRESTGLKEEFPTP